VTILISSRFDSHDKYWKNVHAEAKDFIKALIKPNPDERPTAEQVSRRVASPALKQADLFLYTYRPSNTSG
jgi:hypothetical protein